MTAGDLDLISEIECVERNSHCDVAYVAAVSRIAVFSIEGKEKENLKKMTNG